MWLDHAFRHFLTSDVMAASNVDMKSCDTYIELSIKAATNNLCSKTTPIQILSDMFDIITLDQCETLFSSIERNIILWKSEEFFTPIRNNLLRICNGSCWMLTCFFESFGCLSLLLTWKNLHINVFRPVAKTFKISKHSILWPDTAVPCQIFPGFWAVGSQCGFRIQLGEHNGVQYRRWGCGYQWCHQRSGFGNGGWRLGGFQETRGDRGGTWSTQFVSGLRTLLKILATTGLFSEP